MDFSFLISISDGDEAFIDEFISTFEKTSIPQMQQMKAFAEEKKFDDVKKLAHQIKPTTEMLGFDSHSKIIDLNSDPHQASVSEIQLIIDEAEQVLKALNKEFSR